MGFAAWDAMSVYVSYNLTYLVRIGKWEGLAPGLAVIGAVWLGSSYLIGRYSPVEKKNGNEWIVRLIQTLTTATCIVVLFVCHSWIYQVVDAQTRFRGFLIPLVALCCSLSIAGQLLNWGVDRKTNKWLVVGTDRDKTVVMREIEQEWKGGCEVTFTEPDRGNYWSEEVRGSKYKGVAIAELEGLDDDLVERLLSIRVQGGYVIPLVSWCEQELQRIPPELVELGWLIQAEGFGLRPGTLGWRIKRLGDVIGAVLLIALALPLVCLGGACIWIEDRGPIFYSQVRSGLYGKPIRIWKLRSMRKNAESGTGIQWSTKGDPRVTRVGKIIRATRIDELPQLVSVLNGDLSLIGPRPERPEIEESLEKEIPHYRIRHWIRPGLSGWAQVCYPYGASVEDSRMKLSYDLYYLRNASLLLDILITMKTIRLVANAEGSSPSAEKR